MKDQNKHKDCCNNEAGHSAKHSNHSHNHSDCEHNHGHGMHGTPQEFLSKFWIVTFLLIPLFLTNSKIASLLNIPSYIANKWLSFIIATIIFYIGRVFFEHAWMEIKSKSYGMMTLVSIAVGAGYLFSVFSTFLPSIGTEFYLEISTLIWVLLFGHYLEAKSGSAAGNALAEVEKLLPKEAHLIKENKVINVKVNELKKGDIVLVKPGEKVPADGVIIEGTGNINESHITGESKPIQKSKGNNISSGSIVLDSSLKVEITRVGENSTIGQIKKLIEQAQQTKPKSQKIADKAAAWLTFIAGSTALLTLIIWSLILGQPFVFAMTLAITVLVIACPHALGLAIPTVTTLTTTLSIKNGIFIKNLAKIEVVKKASIVVFDKTGTLTEGNFGVEKIITFGKIKKDDLLKIAGALEEHSSHIIGLSILEYLKSKKITPFKFKNFKNIAGKGVSAVINGETFYAGNENLMTELGVNMNEIKKVENSLRDKTLVFIAKKNQLLGVIALADKIKPESKKAINLLHNLGIKTAMLTGDNEEVAKIVANELNIDTVFANVLPEDKYKHIKNLQKQGHTVLMVGDGVNDAPALTQADVGVAIGAGTDVAVEAGNIVLTNSNPLDIVKLIILSREVYKKMIQNLLWALGYNIVAIPAAAGLFAPWGFFLRPEIGALVMSLSTVIVVANALTLKKLNLNKYYE